MHYIYIDNSHQITSATISPTYCRLVSQVLHRLLQAVTRNVNSIQAAAAPGLRCSTGSCKLSQGMQILFRQQQHQVSAAPQVLASCHKECKFYSGSRSTRSPLLHRFLQAVTRNVNSIQAGAAPGFRCSSGSCKLSQGM
jgi:hypothetical protein